jgi:hypothetical protein
VSTHRPLNFRAVFEIAPSAAARCLSLDRRLWSLRNKWRHLCAFARNGLFIQAAVLAKAQRRKGKEGGALAMGLLNSQSPSTPWTRQIQSPVAATTIGLGRPQTATTFTERSAVAAAIYDLCRTIPSLDGS